MFGLSPMELALLGMIGGGSILMAALVLFAFLRPRDPKE